VRGYVQLDGNARTQAVKLEIPELKVAVEVTPDAAGRATYEFILNGVELWSPSIRGFTPLPSGQGRIFSRRRLASAPSRPVGRTFCSTGNPFSLRGISLHEENPLRGGRATTPADARQLLGWAAQLGCNYVRLAHYPHNEHMARVADEMGILLWAEVPVYWTIHWGNPATYANAENQLTELVTRDRNRASIIIWSMANETPISPVRTEFLKKLVATPGRSTRRA